MTNHLLIETPRTKLNRVMHYNCVKELFWFNLIDQGPGFESGFFSTAVDRIVSMFWTFPLGGMVILFFINFINKKKEGLQARRVVPAILSKVS